MDTWDAVRARRNVREFTGQALPDEALERILEAAWRAPSARNLQPWDFVVVTERAQLERLSAVWQGGGHIAGAAAAVAIVIDADLGEERSALTVSYDLGQASLQMMVVAADLGIGSGHSSVGDQALARSVLGLPESKLLRYIIDFGYPADRPLKPIQKPKRRAFDEVIHRGTW